MIFNIIRVQVASIKNYFSLVKFSHTIFAMPFAMIGFFLGVMLDFSASVVPGWHTVVNSNSLPLTTQSVVIRFILVLLCMVFARSAAMAFNRYLDRTFDAKNPRTAIREIPSGIISANRALVFTIFCAALFILCCWFINPLCFFLSPVALIVVLGYSF